MEKMIISKLRPRSVTPDNSQAPPSKPGQIATDPLFFIDDLNCAGLEKRTGMGPDIYRYVLQDIVGKCNILMFPLYEI